MKVIKESIISQMLLAVTLIISGLIVNAAQILLHIFVKPFSRQLFHRCMYYICWTWLAQPVFVMSYWSNSELIVYGKKEDFEYFGKEHAFALINHTYEIDFLVGWLMLEESGSLGCTRGFGKKSIGYVPIGGWFFALAEHVFLKRSFEKDQKILEERIADYMTYPNSTLMFFTAEGTRFAKLKHEASIEFARERKIEPFKHHLIPRSKGFVTCIPILKKNNCPAVYNVQLAFSKEDPNKPVIRDLLRGRKVVAHVYFSRIPMDKIEPTFECLYDIFKEKDALQDSFYKFGNFFEGRGLKNEEGMRIKPRIRVLINTIVWTLTVVSLMIYYSVKLLLEGRTFLLGSILAGAIVLVLFLHNFIARINRIKSNKK